MLLQIDVLFQLNQDINLFLYVTLQDEEEGVDGGDGWDDWTHGKALIKPQDQLELTEAVSRWQIFIAKA